MRISDDEALNIFKKWQEEGSVIRCLIPSPSFRVVLAGKLDRAADGSVVPRPSSEQDSGSFVAISLTLVRSFEIVGPRDGDDEDREVLESQISFGATIFFLSGESCALYELP
jgi:hypothetical protein